MCYAPESDVLRDSTPKALNYNKKAQLFYFKDLRHMERIGRSNKQHVELRKRFMEAYCPGGVMQSGKLVLWVETTVLKNGEIECEYVGCEVDRNIGLLHLYAWKNSMLALSSQPTTLGKLPQSSTLYCVIDCFSYELYRERI